MDIFDNSILIVAHPDDEILWFSSILKSVDLVIIVFSKVTDNEVWTSGRRKSKQEYPLKNVVWLEIDEAGSFQSANWLDPQESDYGLKLRSNRKVQTAYRNNFKKIKTILIPYLERVENVFTHNPWGEYGNEEHCQIYKIMSDYKKKYGYNIWFPNLVSNKNIEIFKAYASLVSPNYISLATNKLLANRIKEIYQKNYCWTWYDNWEWRSEDVFFSLNNCCSKSNGYSIPLNMVQVKMPPAKKGNKYIKLFFNIKKKVFKRNR